MINNLWKNLGLLGHQHFQHPEGEQLTSVLLASCHSPALLEACWGPAPFTLRATPIRKKSHRSKSPNDSDWERLQVEGHTDFAMMIVDWAGKNLRLFKFGSMKKKTSSPILAKVGSAPDLCQPHADYLNASVQKFKIGWHRSKCTPNTTEMIGWQQSGALPTVARMGPNQPHPGKGDFLKCSSKIFCIFCNFLRFYITQIFGPVLSSSYSCIARSVPTVSPALLWRVNGHLVNASFLGWRYDLDQVP